MMMSVIKCSLIKLHVIYNMTLDNCRILSHKKQLHYLFRGKSNFQVTSCELAQWVQNTASELMCHNENDIINFTRRSGKQKQ